jgi:dTDP-4-amino-4,6-dideoxygalactose transaminase
MLGHNYHMPEIAAAIGVEQLKKLPGFVAKRRRNAKRLSEKLAKARNLSVPQEPEGFKPSYYLYTVRLMNVKRTKRDDIVSRLRQKGIDAFVCYVNPIHLMPYYHRFCKHRLSATENASAQVLSLPVHPGVTSQQIDFIGDTMLQLLK